jgi:hypothetical protein
MEIRTMPDTESDLMRDIDYFLKIKRYTLARWPSSDNAVKVRRWRSNCRPP